MTVRLKEYTRYRFGSVASNGRLWRTSIENQLLAALRRGDDTAFRQIAQNELGGLYAIAYGILGNVADAEDVCQEVLLKLHQTASRLALHTSLRAWLRRVCVNQCLDELRRRRWNARGKESAACLEALSAGDTSEASAFRLAVRRALQEISPRQRVIFVLRHFQQCSVQETAHLVGCAEGTVKTQFSRALQALRTRLKDWDPTKKGGSDASL